MSDSNTRKTILIIDDEEQIRETTSDYLEDIGFKTILAEDGLSGISRFREDKPDAVLADLSMPNIDGFEVIRTVIRESPETPIIVMSGIGIIEKAVLAVREGAWDFLAKPISSFEILKITFDRCFERANLISENRRYREHLEEEVDIKTREILNLERAMSDTQKEIILTLGEVVETRSKETAYHVRRVGESACLLAQKCGLSSEFAANMRLAAPMHDVGKIGIPDTILNSARKLTDAEFEIIKTHTILGYEIFSKASLPVMNLAATIAYEHHEQWSGKGYPRQLKGNKISIEGRITCIADIFDALVHDRSYKKSWSIDDTCTFMKNNSGVIFDPEMLTVFLDNLDEFLLINKNYTE
jgi:putative two-component system response regulator